MKTQTFSCQKNHPGNRATLEWLAKKLDSAPLTVHLLTNVDAFRVDSDLAGNHFTFTVDNEFSLRSLQRNIGKIREAMITGYREHVDMELETVSVELQKA